jgi:hypothetical protein
MGMAFVSNDSCSLHFLSDRQLDELGRANDLQTCPDDHVAVENVFGGHRRTQPAPDGEGVGDLSPDEAAPLPDILKEIGDLRRDRGPGLSNAEDYTDTLNLWNSFAEWLSPQLLDAPLLNKRRPTGPERARRPRSNRRLGNPYPYLANLDRSVTLPRIRRDFASAREISKASADSCGESSDE